MKNIALQMMFDGAGYHGFQRQKNGNTIQAEVESAISSILCTPTEIIGCSRTDAGVHAKNYVCMFSADTNIADAALPKAFNSALPDDIRIVKAWECGADFHPIFSAVEKTYTYTIVNRRCMDVFLRNYAWFYPILLSVPDMQKAAEHFLGTHDFSACMAAGGSAKTTVRDIKRLSITEKDGVISIHITANGFLYNMVRIITGTLVCVGNGRFSKDDIVEILESGDRRRAGMTAPPQGLMLSRIVYPDFTVGEYPEEK